MGPPPATRADAHFPLRQNRFFPARETHVAGQGDLTAVSRRPTPDRGDRHNRRARQAHEYVRPRLESGRPLRYAGQILELGEEIAMVEEKSFDSAIEDDDFHLLVGSRGPS